MKAQLTWLMVLSSVALGCGDDSPKVPPGPGPARSLIDALMAHVHVKGARVKLGNVADPTDSADTVKLATPQGVLRLLPRSSSLMPLEVDRPQREPAVEATLMQFEGAEEHFEVLVSEPEISDEDSLALQHQFDVDLEVCDTLCNQRYAAKLIIAIRLEGGAVSKHHELAIVLDCRERGDEAYCDGAPPPAPDDGAGIDAATQNPRQDGGAGRDAASEDAATPMDAATGLDGGMPADAAVEDATVEDSAAGDAAPLEDAAPPVDGSTSEVPAQLTGRTPDTAVADSAFRLTITGTGIASGAVAYFDGQLLETVSAEDTMLIADVPSTATARPGSLAVFVENTPGEVTSRSNVVYLTISPAPGAPVIYDYSPDNGVAGDVVLIIASDLAGQTLAIEDAEGTAITPGALSTISWPRTFPAPAGVVTADTVQITLPSGIATGPITVTNDIGSYRGKIFNVGSNLTRLPGTVLTSSSEYNDSNWSRASGGDNLLSTSFFTIGNDCATDPVCTIDPWFQITFQEPQTVARIAMRGNREYTSGYDFLRARFEVFGAGDALLFQADYDLPAPDRDLDIVLAEPIEGAVSVKFSSLEDESLDPGFSELEVFGP